MTEYPLVSQPLALVPYRPQKVVPPFGPAALPGLQFDLNADLGMFADAGLTLATAGGTVRQATDQSGQGHTASQATAGNRPTYRTAVANGHAALEFNGTTSFLKTTPFPLKQPVTVFLVARILAVQSGKRSFMDGNSDDALAGYWNGAVAQWRISAGTAEVVGGTTDVTAFHVLEAVFDGGASLAKVDGNAGASGNPGTPNPGGITLGAIASGTSQFGNYQLARGLVYAAALTATQRQQLRSLLGTTYGVTVS